MESEVFSKAIKDYHYLVDNKYPEKGSLKLVGDRYRLSTEERTILYRGVCSSAQRKLICQRLIKQDGGLLIIDGYNVLITLLNYRLGHKVFISTDNMCRDAGALFGKIRDEQRFSECIELLLNYLKSAGYSAFTIYLDEPVSKSRQHSILLQEELTHRSLAGTVELVRSADEALSTHRSGVLATSDSAILMHSVLPVLDIPRYIIENHYHARLTDLYAILTES